MRTGISTASLFMRQCTEDAVSTIKNLGADCIEVFLSTFYEYRPEFAKKYAPRAEGTEVSSVHSLPLNFEHQLFSSDNRVRGDGFYWLDQLMRSAQLFGCRKYTFHGRNRNADFVDNFDSLARTIGRISEFCSGYGVELCLENVAWSTYNRPGMFRQLKNRFGGLSGVFDIKQARRSGYPYAMYIEDMAGAISHVHLSDVNERGEMCLPGKGIYDFEEILNRLKGAGFDGEILIEVYPDNYGDVKELKTSLEFLNEIIYKLK